MGSMARSVQRLRLALVLVLATATVGATQVGQPPAALRQPAPPVAQFTAAELLADVQTLASPAFEGRRTGTPGHAQARAFIVERFRSIGLTPFGDSFEMPFQFTRNDIATTGVNVVALCRGTAGGDRGAMVISAHYDHLGIRDGVLYPGADDNASGVAVLLALARQCRNSPWMHDAVFAAFDAEEMSLQGARAFVATPPIPKERIRLNVNMDMVARGDKREIYIAGTYHWPQLKPPLEAVAARSAITVLFGYDKPKDLAGGREDWTMQSDHGAFHAAGIPFVYFGVEDHPDYHKPTDTPEKIDPQFFFESARTILDAITTLDRALPLAPR
jgi:Zn-dependent M28 family amino/carboxypeptidase